MAATWLALESRESSDRLPEISTSSWLLPYPAYMFSSNSNLSLLFPPLHKPVPTMLLNALSITFYQTQSSPPSSLHFEAAMGHTPHSHQPSFPGLLLCLQATGLVCLENMEAAQAPALFFTHTHTSSLTPNHISRSYPPQSPLKAHRASS